MKDLKNKKYKSVDSVISTWDIVHFILILFFLGIFQPAISYILDKFQINDFLINEFTIFMSVFYFVISFTIIKWNLWAFKNTKKEDWVELEQKAFEKRIIYKKDYLYRTNRQKRLIKDLTNEIERLRNEKNLPPPKIEKKWFEKFDISKPFDFLLLFTVVIIYFVFNFYF